LLVVCLCLDPFGDDEDEDDGPATPQYDDIDDEPVVDDESDEDASAPAAAADADEEDEEDDDDDESALSGEIEYDDDEFEGFEGTNVPASDVPAPDLSTAGHDTIGETTSKTKSSSSKDKSKKTSKSQSGSVGSAKAEPDNYQLEYMALTLVFVYAINYFLGRKSNDSIAESWYFATHSVFADNFAALGRAAYHETVGQYAMGNDGQLVKDSNSIYKFYASGRKHCKGVLATIQLRNRHDLFSVFMDAVGIGSDRDSVTLEISMDSKQMEPSVFCIMRNRDVKKLHSQLEDLRDFASVIETDKVPDSHTVLTDAGETIGAFMTQQASKVIRDNKKLFSMMHLTDAFSLSFSVTKGVLRFTFDLPSKKSDMKGITDLTRMAMNMIDSVARFKLSSNAKSRCLKLRAQQKKEQEAANSQEKQEEIQKRVDERREREAARIAAMDPDARRKYEAREARRAAKKMKPKVRMLKM
jgi:PAT complex subunit CCDC47